MNFENIRQRFIVQLNGGNNLWVKTYMKISYVVCARVRVAVFKHVNLFDRNTPPDLRYTHTIGTGDGIFAMYAHIHTRVRSSASAKTQASFDLTQISHRNTHFVFCSHCVCLQEFNHHCNRFRRSHSHSNTLTHTQTHTFISFNGKFKYKEFFFFI